MSPSAPENGNQVALWGEEHRPLWPGAAARYLALIQPHCLGLLYKQTGAPTWASLNYCLPEPELTASGSVVGLFVGLLASR
ncbi:hypothetical protein RRG08_014978 [Elysia crispata]|uniref:Uncharacterized protein n=1 Tax=Elysia crispata TaxID=231223 RepID=A0AAE1DNB3_9GAST|nr:hypothetical protein RRG08_014978 [Elysia crispata]